MKINKNGFTLVELLTAIIIFGLLAAFAANMTAFSIKGFERIGKRAQLREQAFVALDFITTHVKLAKGYNIIYNNRGYLQRLSLFIVPLQGAAEHKYIFEYNKSNARLSFGGVSVPGVTLPGVNELAIDITDLVITVDDKKKLMYISVVASDNSGELITLNTSVNLEHIELR